ncbi:MAG: lyso-ornithine lipid O-acyltransferase [Acetobacteraceae bacterium]|jgi:1-acyl-sn-glycerol-3-phosphate acyltransferase|nr:lyso-ornithine lipid O-acyltransferase [Acetobacteraceae bacterium]
MGCESNVGLKERAGRAERRSPLLSDPDRHPGFLLELPNGREGWLVARRVRVARRALAILTWTVSAALIQGVCLMLPGRAKVGFARLYWAVFTRLMGIRVRVIGSLALRTAGRPVVFVSNHSSWVDIPVVGGVLDGCFVAKGDVATWPIISTIARLGRTVFVTRSRTSTGRERDAMRAVLAAGDNLILFPEGTSSDGSRVLPFRTSFFALAELRPGEDMSQLPIIQPVSVVYDRLGGLPTGRASRPVFAWYGDMDIASHFRRLTQHIGLRVTVLLHAPLDPAQFEGRKALSQAVWQIVADGASTLRQNRAASPLKLPESRASGKPAPTPALV